MSVHVAIIGAYGSAGVAAADELLERDSAVELTLIDDGDPGGGLCILRGCMPSKDVLSAGQHRYQARHDDRLEGVPEIDPQAVVARKDEHISGFAEHRREHVHDLAGRDRVEFIHDTARFVDDRVLELEGSGRHLEPDYVVIATGSVLNIPDLSGINDVEIASSADVLETTAFPDSGIVMGFGYIGLELAPYLSEVGGVDLTVIEHDEYPLDEMEADYGETLLELYRDQFGIEVLTNTDEKRLESTAEGGVRLTVEQAGGDGSGDATADSNPVERTLEADQLYCFTGRRPALDGLGLEHTSLEPDEGWVSSTMQAAGDERVFVAGDANGREPILHVAKEEGISAAQNILSHHRGEDCEPYTNIPHHVIFSGLGVYPFARIGHTPATVAETDMDAIIVSREASSDGVFKTKNHPEGRATLIVNAETGDVLGYQGLHLHADVMAKTMQVAVEMGLDVRDLPKRAYHPTTPEILDGLWRDACAKLEDRDACVEDGDSRDLAL
ncbi:NAD(P)/FAD-dependent oxidoreductase [Natronolimnobius sp. AArcel1]|uniref:dihydrolipoyl dehydrogenase family protein n=1 Tax=Natronolimnobius sp. AArcel1 TaxID=1679093 RepID=UPI0013EE080A|nr:NAD(P)/FAD-dependent oxidoreductase [Natronolimnobius sp. AArcel1]NGM68124.1 NAD(P)/FAD-dependent oxidoreductase [Natronolimnobius sp. AArcel1]